MSMRSFLCALALMCAVARAPAVDLEVVSTLAPTTPLTNGTFIQFGPLGPIEGHPQVGRLYEGFRQFAGEPISNVSGDSLIGFMLRSPLPIGDPNIAVNFCWLAGAIPGQGSTAIPTPAPFTDGVLVNPTPQGAYNYPWHPYPIQDGNVFGIRRFSVGGLAPNAGLAICPLVTNTIGLLPSGQTTATINVQVEAPFPGAWRLTYVANVAGPVNSPFVWSIGGIALPNPQPTPKVRSLNYGDALLSNQNRPPILGTTVDVLYPPLRGRGVVFPTAPSETEFTYRLYNVGTPALIWNGITFRSLAGGVTARVKRVLAQDGTPIMDVDSNTVTRIFSPPYTVPGYDGTYSPEGPRAFKDGSSPVAPWIDIVLGLTISDVGDWELETNYLTNGSPSTYTCSIVGTAGPAPEIQVVNGTTNLISGITTLDAGTLYNNVPSAGRVYDLVIRNTGTANLNIPALPATFTSATALGEILPGGTWDGTTALALVPGDYVTLRVRISPTLGDPPDAGSFSISLNILNNDFDEAPFVITWGGTARKRTPILEVSRDRVIPNNGADVVIGVGAGAPTTLTYTVRNAGYREMDVTAVTIASSVNAAVATLSAPGLPWNNIPPGGTQTFTIDVQAASLSLIWRIDVDIVSDTDSYLPQTFTTQRRFLTSYAADSSEDKRECGFGFPFGLIVALTALLFARRRRI